MSARDDDQGSFITRVGVVHEGNNAFCSCDESASDVCGNDRISSDTSGSDTSSSDTSISDTSISDTSGSDTSTTSGSASDSSENGRYDSFSSSSSAVESPEKFRCRDGAADGSNNADFGALDFDVDGNAAPRTRYKFNSARVCGSLKFVALALYCCVCLCLFGLLLAGTDVVYAIARARGVDMRQRVFVDNYTADGYPSFLLFPGVPIAVGQLIDIFYLVPAAMWTLFPCALVASSCYSAHSCCFFPDIHRWIYARFNVTRRILLYAALPNAWLLALHALGNVHYQFYCAVGVIPQHNCFALFDIRSLAAGYAVPFLLFIVGFGAWLIVRLARCLFFFCFDPVPLASE